MKTCSVLLLTLVLFLKAGCADAPDLEMTAPADAVFSNAISADSSPDDIAAHLLEAEHEARATTALVENFPELDRGMAYKVQLRALERELAQGERLIGWKMGGSRVVDPAVGPDPSFAYMLASDSLVNGQVLNADAYVDGVVQVEAEVAFVMGRDLPGPTVTIKELRDAIGGVVGAIEIISVRAAPSPDGTTPTTDHMIAAQLSHGGVMLTGERLPLDAIDVAAEVGMVEVDGEQKASGAGSQIMGTNPLDAMLWIANALPQYGHYLRAGDVVITGSLYDNPTITSGQSATVRFTSLGSLSVSME